MKIHSLLILLTLLPFSAFAELKGLEGEWMVNNFESVYTVNNGNPVVRSDILSIYEEELDLGSKIGRKKVYRFAYKGGAQGIPFGTFNGVFKVADRDGLIWDVENNVRFVNGSIEITTKRKSLLGSKVSIFTFSGDSSGMILKVSGASSVAGAHMSGQLPTFWNLSLVLVPAPLEKI